MYPLAEETPIKEVSFRLYRHPEDYNAAYHVWDSAGKGIHITFSDAPEEIEKLVKRSPDLSFVAEVDKQIVGTVMGGFDGRRGLIYHLAVLPEYRHRQIGHQLMSHVEDALLRKGCTKVYLFIMPDNMALADFYANLGYDQMDVIPFTKYLGEKPV